MKRRTPAHSPRAFTGVHRSRRRSTSRRNSDAEVDGVDVERLSFMNTALEALPGATLREFFTPVMRLRKNIIMRRKRTRERLLTGDKASSDKKITDALNSLAKSLVTSAAEAIPDGTFPLDPAAFVQSLRDKAELISYTADDVLQYPSEPPESAFVYVLLNGSVQLTNYQPQLRRSAGADRKQYYTTDDDMLLLCGGGAHVQNALAALNAGEGEGADGANGAGDAASASNVTSAIQRSLRRVSRSVGQPTLQATRSEILKAPLVIGASEVLGLAPTKCISYQAVSTAAPASSKDGHYLEFTDVVRVRALDIHHALLDLAEKEKDARHAKNSRNSWFSAPQGSQPPRGVQRTLADFIAAARSKVLGMHFPQNEVLMRQSWLLQDTPSPTVRSLIARLTARTYMPQEVIACPHNNSSMARQLCFLRRGRILVVEPGSMGSVSTSIRPGKTHPCTCGSAPFTKVLEVVKAGASFGELSVLFGESRNYALVADSMCDAWCLPHRDFAHTMRRDDGLRNSLVAKAALLRIRWLGEQRYTPALAHHLRSHCDLLRPFSDLVLRLIQERIEPVVFSPGTLVASTANRCNEMIFIIQGQVSSICEGVAAYGPGDVVGEGCLVAHRWPLGLVARTMVEGWRLSRAKLQEALDKADILRQYSGESNTQVPVIMKQIFQPPVPELEADGVRRQRMPFVPPAPGGEGYPAYARRISEVQLKALCYMHRDYVKWEDISYASMESSKNPKRNAQSEAMAREYVIAKLKKKNGGGAPPDLAQAIAASSGQRPSAAGSGRAAVNAAHTNNTSTNGAAPSPPTAGKPAKRLHPRQKAKRRNNNGPCAFYVNSDVTLKPFAQRHESTVLQKYKAPEVPESKAIVLQSTDDMTISDDVRRAEKMPRRLKRFTGILSDRDRALASQMRHEAVREKRLAAAAAARSDSPDLPIRGADAAADGNDAGERLPPVHRFLMSDKPRTEISMAEAIAIGYVLQLPDTHSVQSCVSFNDPDVTLGFPPHRGRRHRMATTPNDRFHKHNFLFAAACFENTSKIDQQIKEKRDEEQMKRNKAVKLMAMLRSTSPTSARKEDLPSGVLKDEPSSMVMNHREPDAAAPVSGMTTPLRANSAARASSRVATPSAGTPSRSVRSQQGDAFVRMLNNDPVKAMDMLYNKHDMAWEEASEGHSAAEAGGGAAASPAGGSGSRRASLLLERMREAAAAGDGGRKSMSQLTTAGPPALAMATSRDRFQSQQTTHLEGAPGSPTAPPPGESGRTMTLANVQPTALEGHIQNEDNPLFVDNYGALGSVGSAAQQHHLEESAAAVAQLLIDDLAKERSVTFGPAGSPHEGEPRALVPSDFLMPDLDYSNIFIRRIQRDVDGLNAVAREQTRERERARQRARRLGQHAKDAEAMLMHPDEDEAQVLEDWQTAYEYAIMDPLQGVQIPNALSAHAGPDYLRHGIVELGQCDETVDEAGRVTAWQDQYSSKQGAVNPDKPSAAVRVVAAVGTSQLGYETLPLSNPAQHLDGGAYQGWVKDREAFFTEYSRMTAHGEYAKEPLQAPVLPRPPSPQAAAAAAAAVEGSHSVLFASH